MNILTRYNWPGNVRELHNAIERAVVVTKDSLVTAEALPMLNGTSDSEKSQSLEAIEKAHIQRILETMGGNVSRSADILKIDRKTLYQKIEKFELRR
jgi:transcriptional regulator with PAS, ATPase and Fis domain